MTRLADTVCKNQLEWQGEAERAFEPDAPKKKTESSENDMNALKLGSQI